MYDNLNERKKEITKIGGLLKDLKSKEYGNQCIKLDKTHKLLGVGGFGNVYKTKMVNRGINFGLKLSKMKKTYYKNYTWIVENQKE